MPAKKNPVITVGEARKLFRDDASMLTAIHFFQFAAGDRKEDARMRVPNQRDIAVNRRYVEDDEREKIREITGKLITAIQKKA